MKRILLHLSATLEPSPPSTPPTEEQSIAPTTAQSDPNEFLVSMLVGDGTYNGIFFPLEEIAKTFTTMDAQPFNLDHSEAVEDEIGFVRQPGMFEKAMKGIAVLNPKTARYNVGRAYIENRFAAKKPPEVSVGVFLDLIDEEVNGEVRPTARNLAFDHLALVTRGACSPAAGCGVGLAAAPTQENKNMKENKNPAPAPETKTEQTPTPPACGCSDLKAQLAKVQVEHDAAQKELAAYRAEKRAALVKECATFGVTVAESDTLDCLNKKLGIAREVAAKLAANPKPNEQPNTQRHTAAAGSEGDPAKAESDRLLARMGLAL